MSTLFSYVKSHVSIFDVISEYAQLKKAGLYWKSNCPFHHEKTASFTVSPHRDIFYCFGCHSGGDVIAFIAKAEHCTPLEAAQHLIDRYQIEIPATLADQKSSSELPADRKKKYFQLCAAVAAWAHAQLCKTPFALHYLKKRGLSDHSMKRFQLGYFPGGPTAINDLLEYLKKEHFFSDDLVQAHIIAQSKAFFYSPFEQRIIFPIKDHLGRFCGFGGRIFKESDTRAKYYNSKENAFFTKGSLVFGLDSAKKNMQETTRVFLVEGYLDCIAMVQQGYINTVATLGTACTIEHLTSLARYAQEIFIVYDSDKAGQQAIMRLAQMCWHVNIDLYVITLPAGEDPASFLQKGSLSSYIDKAVDIFEFFIERSGSEFASKNLHQKLTIAHTLIDTIATIQDPLKRQLLLQKASQKLAIPLESLQQRPHQAVVKAVTAPTKEAKLEEQNNSETVEIEKKIFFAILHNSKLLGEANQEYLGAYLSEPFATYIQTMTALRVKTPDLSPQMLFGVFYDGLDAEQQKGISRMMVEYNESIQESDFNQLLLFLQKKHWKVAVSTVKQRLAQTTSQETADKILHDFMILKKSIIKNS